IGLLRLFKDKIKLLRLQKYYSKISSRSNNTEQYIVYMADGKMLHGGLSDRFCGLISTYNYCLEHNIKFKIFFNSPYKLKEFFLPNKYDWTINEQHLSYNSIDSQPVYIPYIHQISLQKQLTKQRLSSKKSQLHVYT